MTNAAIIQIVDKLADTRAQIADLQKAERQLKEDLIGRGHTHYEGTQHDVSISFGVVREVLDAEKVKRRLTQRVYNNCLRTTKPSTIVRITARKQEAA